MIRPGIRKGLLLLSVLIIGYASTDLYSSKSPLITVAKASPLIQNSNPECPPNSGNIWVHIDHPAYKIPNEPDQTLSIPFESGYVTVRGHRYVNYLLGVLLREIGPTSDFDPVDEELMKAKAILARTLTYKNCGIYSFDGHPGMDDSDKQVYDPRRGEEWLTNHPDLVARYQAAIDATRGMYLTHNGSVFDVKYGNTSHEWTSGNTAPHIGIYDPAGRHHSVRTQEGLSQINANHYARGDNHGERLPPYDYRRLVGHYFNNIRFVGISPSIPNNHYQYLFDVLHFGQRYGGFSGGYDDRFNDPIIMRQGHTFTFDSIIQNTSSQSWSLSCNNGVALSYHLYTFPGKQYLPGVYFEGARNHLCPSAADGNSLAPGQTFPSQANSNRFLRTEIWIDYAITPGDYWLRLDMEFPFIAWGSGLHPQNNPNNPLWPPQDIHIYVEKQQPDPPNPGVTSGHSYGSSNTTWSPDDTVAMSWSAVSDRLLDYYKVCWNQRNGGQDGCHNNGTNTSFSRTLSNGIYDFELTTMTDDNTPSNPAIIENIRIDATDPTAELDPLPIRVQAPDYVLEWNSGDTGGSGFVAQQLTYQINNDGNWRSVPAASNDLGMRSIRFYFPEGQHGDVYEFCLTTRDGAGNSSVSCDSTTFNPDPDLYVEPLKLTWQTVYSNTLPNTQTLTIENYGGVVLNWSITTPFTLATVGQTTGTAPSIVPVVLTHPVGITATYQGYITVTGTTPGTRNSPKIVEVIIYVRERDNTLYFPIIFKQ